MVLSLGRCVESLHLDGVVFLDGGAGLGCVAQAFDAVLLGEDAGAGRRVISGAEYWSC